MSRMYGILGNRGARRVALVAFEWYDSLKDQRLHVEGLDVDVSYEDDDPHNEDRNEREQSDEREPTHWKRAVLARFDRDLPWSLYRPRPGELTVRRSDPERFLNEEVLALIHAATVDMIANNVRDEMNRTASWYSFGHTAVEVGVDNQMNSWSNDTWFVVRGNSKLVVRAVAEGLDRIEKIGGGVSSWSNYRAPDAGRIEYMHDGLVARIHQSTFAIGD